jgi:hypothetical protein
MKFVLLATVLTLLITACATVVGPVGPDNVGFPTNYRSEAPYATVDRVDNKQVREIFTSAQTAKLVRAGKPIPEGAVFIMPIYAAKADAKDELAKDARGRLVKGDLSTIFVMEKRAGWGAGYPDELRNGEWEYARFTPDGQRMANVDTKPCLQCHKPMAKQDFVFSLPRLTGAAK